MRARRTLAERFWDKVDKRGPDECWEWTAARSNGYGRIGVGRAVKVAHRLGWELLYGAVPSGIDVCHRCDNRACCNPGHLFLGTRQDNVDDMMRKGRYGQREHRRGGAHPMAKLSEPEVRLIRCARGIVTAPALAERFDVSKDHVYHIWYRRCWRGHASQTHG